MDEEKITVPVKRLVQVLSQVLSPHVAMAIVEELRGAPPEPPRRIQPSPGAMARAEKILQRAGVRVERKDRR